MKVSDWLHEQGLSADELASLLGHKNATTVKRYLPPRGDRSEREMPKTWLEKLQGEPAAPQEAAAAAVSEAEAIVEQELRRSQGAPQRPAGGRIQVPAGERPLDYGALAGQIEGAYRLAAQTVRAAEPVLAQVIDDHAAAAGSAWAKWVESEPRVAALLQRMMVGTPMGEVIFVHVGIVFSYTLARSSARQLAREAAERSAAAAAASSPASDGSAQPPAGDRLAGAP